MRPELADPIKNRPLYQATLEIVREIYHLYEGENDFESALLRLSALTGKRLSRDDLEGAAELIPPEAFAYEISFDRDTVPRPLTLAEMLELVRRVREFEGDELQTAYWIWCLEANTGDARISYLLQCPESYSDESKDARGWSHERILDTALLAGGGWITPSETTA